MLMPDDLAGGGGGGGGAGGAGGAGGEPGGAPGGQPPAGGGSLYSQGGQPPAGGAPGGQPPAGGAPGGQPPAGTLQGEECLKLFGDAGKTGLFQGINNPDELVKRMGEYKSRADTQGIKIPGENATTEEMDAFYRAIGRPDAPDGYQLTDKGIDPASGVQLDPDLMDWSAKTFHALGVPKAMAEKMSEAWNERMSRMGLAQKEAIAKMGETTVNELKQFYGAEQFNGGMQQMHNAVRAVAGEDADAVEALLARPEVGNDPVVMKFMARLGQFWGKAVGEEGMKMGDRAGLGSIIGPAEAKSRINAIMGDKKDSYWDKRHPNNAQRVQEVAELYKVIQQGGVK